MTGAAHGQAETRLDSPYGSFELRRYPARKRELLRAWDAADEYLLHSEPLAEGRCLVVNDGFGALSLALASKRPVNWSDSWLAQHALKLNLERNAIAPGTVPCVPSTEQPTGCFDSVWIKLPKNLGLLQHQLLQLRNCVTPGTRILLTGMIRNMPSSVWQLAETLLGPTLTLPGRKKAKLIQVGFDPALRVAPSRFPLRWPLPGTDLVLHNHANVFSRDRLDPGARLLMENLPSVDDNADVIDLGCGNGVLGLMIARANPESNVRLVDESFMAVESAQRNLQQLADRPGQIEVIAGDGLTGFAGSSADLVLCNPPFHQQHSLNDTIAVSMFSGARRVLRPGGVLWVVGNRHLGYHKTLKRWFKRVELVASNRKFVVLRAARGC